MLYHNKKAPGTTPAAFRKAYARNGHSVTAMDQNRQAAYANKFFLSLMQAGQKHPLLVRDIADETLCHVIPPAR